MLYQVLNCISRQEGAVGFCARGMMTSDGRQYSVSQVRAFLITETAGDVIDYLSHQFLTCQLRRHSVWWTPFALSAELQFHRPMRVRIEIRVCQWFIRPLPSEAYLP